jgi:hypothetical protein
MSFNSRLKYNQNATYSTATSITAVAAASTVGTAAGNKILTKDIMPGAGVVAKCTMLVNTTSLTLTPKWQGSQDASSWEDIFTINSAANVATAAGTGSDVTTTRSLYLPGVPPYK